MRGALLGLTLLSATLAAQAAEADPITFRTEQYGCELSIFGDPKGRVEPDRPMTVDLHRGREYLVECESHDIPVKLYARENVFSRGDFRNGALPADVIVDPVAVLPNVVRAAAAKKIDVIAAADSISVACKVDIKNPKDSFSRESHQIASPHPLRIMKGSPVQLTGAPQMHCGDTNLIEAMVDGSKAWFRNRDFVFSYEDKPISLYPPSQDFECCWID
jgi:hypothetical protein